MKMDKEKSILITKSLADDLNICFHWMNEFNILFPENELQYDLLDKIAPNFFHYLSHFYYDYFFLKISKMLDPATISGFENLSLFQLINISKKFFPEKEEVIKIEINKIKRDASIILNARKKIIAHRDLTVAINEENLGETKFTEIESLIKRMSGVINLSLENLGEPTISFVWMTDRFGARSLIQALKETNYYRDLKRDRKLYNDIKRIESDSKYNKL